MAGIFVDRKSGRCVLWILFGIYGWTCFSGLGAASTPAASQNLGQRSGNWHSANNSGRNSSGANQELQQPSSDIREPPKQGGAADGNWNIKTKTFGGLQFWTDLHYAGGWRIQRNATTGHCRLLDSQNVRHAWGSFAACRSVLEQRIADGSVKPNSGKVVVLVHGLIRASRSMHVVGAYLEKRGDFTPVVFEYASSRAPIATHAKALRQFIDSLGPEVTEIHFVAHSLGTIVVRRYMFDTTDPATGQQGDSRIRRMVMMGPPNNGSQMARFLGPNLIFKTVMGACGSELGDNWQLTNRYLAIPKVEFGIIAGATKTNIGNVLIPGKDDLTVGVEETKLAGASDFLVLPLYHPTMMKQSASLEATLSFLRHGYFRTAHQRQPIANTATSSRGKTLNHISSDDNSTDGQRARK
jgi:pimeloyl-ACP methyl ester carboxylesterase